MHCFYPRSRQSPCYVLSLTSTKSTRGEPAEPALTSIFSSSPSLGCFYLDISLSTHIIFTTLSTEVKLSWFRPKVTVGSSSPSTSTRLESNADSAILWAHNLDSDESRPGFVRKPAEADGQAYMLKSLRSPGKLLFGADSLDSDDAPGRARPSRSIIIGAQSPP